MNPAEPGLLPEEIEATADKSSSMVNRYSRESLMVLSRVGGEHRRHNLWREEINYTETEKILKCLEEQWR